MNAALGKQSRTRYYKTMSTLILILAFLGTVFLASASFRFMWKEVRVGAQWWSAPAAFTGLIATIPVCFGIIVLADVVCKTLWPVSY